MSKAQTRMASLKYKLSHVSPGIGMLICLQLRGYMKGITGSVDSRRSSNAPWSKARREYLLGGPLSGAVLPSSCLRATQAQPAVQSWSRTGPGGRSWSENMVASLFVVTFYVGCSRTGNIWSGMKPTDTDITFQLFWKCFSWLGEFLLAQCCYCSGLYPWNRICCIVKLHPENNIPPTRKCHHFVPECLQVQQLLFCLS